MNPRADMMAIAETELRELYDYWLGKRRDGRLPGRHDIDLDALEDLEPYIALVEVLGEGRYFRFERIGSDLRVGIDPTGKLQHEEVPKGIYGDHITALYRRGAIGPGALYSRSAYAYSDIEGPRAISRLFLPLASDGLIIDNMIIGQLCDPKISSGHSPWQANAPTVTEVVELRLP